MYSVYSSSLAISSNLNSAFASAYTFYRLDSSEQNGYSQGPLVVVPRSTLLGLLSTVFGIVLLQAILA